MRLIVKIYLDNVVSSNESSDVDDDVSLLFDYSNQRQARLKKRNLKLSHYTTADVGAKILLNRDIWMRNASSMNDYLEFTHGSNCLKIALSKHGRRFLAALNAVRANLCEEVLEWLHRSDYVHQYHTYLTALSEHRVSDDLGRLSMWRAYGGNIAGVCLVFNTDFLDMDSDSLASWSSPVIYGEERFLSVVEQTISRIENNIERLRAVDPDTLRSLIFNYLQFSVLSSKHIGFSEEREWRVIHGPREFSSPWVQPTFESVRGHPEVVYHMPLENRPEMNLPEIDLDRLLHRVIIGPCQNPYQIASTFEDILQTIGVSSPAERIRVSLIPLRQDFA